MNDTTEPDTQRLSFFALMVGLLALMLASGFVDRWTGRLVLDLAMTLVLLAGVWSTYHHRGLLMVGMVVAVPALVTRWIDLAVPDAGLTMTVSILTAGFMIFNAAALFLYIVRQGQPRNDTVYGGVCIYVLLGFVWRELYLLVEMLHPGSFTVAAQAEAGLAAVEPYLMYFSFVTLTTLGYGDVSPVGDIARTLSTLEAVIGQMFVAVFIARLVGLRPLPSRSPGARNATHS